MMNRAIKIGGKKAPRRIPTRRQIDADNDKGFLTALAGNGYKCNEVKDIDCCNFMAENDSVINYQTPEIKAVTKDNTIIGYIVKGKGELLGDNNKNFDLDTIVKYLSSKGINVEDLVERVQNGDKKALEEILEIVKKSAVEEDEASAKSAEEKE
ncbi:hypothetical protein NEMIN01_1263 [Nematocida minor]|uniref:uncharacterized protein n=1 Tax=Nematocida minor TaxID=1912983 RepID=UPI00221F48E6|nr:uncharacterized protein NEMIN01_1263 [Nematocida minor]KAI5190861.1 hypothetical protein NEMIN01_1263 [Nematocida minor]